MDNAVVPHLRWSQAPPLPWLRQGSADFFEWFAYFLMFLRLRSPNVQLVHIDVSGGARSSLCPSGETSVPKLDFRTSIQLERTLDRRKFRSQTSENNMDRREIQRREEKKSQDERREIQRKSEERRCKCAKQ